MTTNHAIRIFNHEVEHCPRSGQSYRFKLAARSSLLQEEAVDSGNNIDTCCLADTPGLGISNRRIFGWSLKTDQSIATGPKGVQRMQKDDLAVSLVFMRLTAQYIEISTYLNSKGLLQELLHCKILPISAEKPQYHFITHS